MGSILKIGHRGAKGYLAENTLESIQKALEFGVDAIEIDVHRCKTGEIVVFHDFTLDRTTNGSGEVANKTFAELKALKVENAYKIPLLTEVLGLIVGKCSVNIELKGLNTAKATAEIIKNHIIENDWKYDEFIISSFQKNELFQMRKLEDKVPLGVLSKASVPEAIELGKLLNASAIHPSLGIITRENVKKSQAAGFKVNVWTVNEPRDIQRMLEFGVDGIISDFPDRLF
ncbi:glycerophosphoryl diester phosphodiesterase [Salegentibacter echinorum]|uniref:Glycerophosphoryl diester phosphodiesterase n=1 Tax=Salegentibacter echinorum TaxID=1073325 RepID=A0A1M5H740_SALEC|nr:glycerophosphodiester phosphodiesterase family protein [Salegentibacter echinorum]SHG11807.1 glycerophosphoryl diester phosphodiesterase [Salegentibacter echinorum]